jgi:hypothetical protein
VIGKDWQLYAARPIFSDVVGGRKALFVEFEGWKAHFVAVVGSRKALLVV